MSREQIIRDTAYAIWEAEGKPEGRDSDHWREAEARVAGSLSGGATPQAKARSSNGNGAAKNTKATPAGKKPAKAAIGTTAKPASKAAKPKDKPAD